MRAGTSKAVFFAAASLPTNTEQRDRLLLKVMGSPDPYGRQLNGMGGGLSSVSKVCIIGPSAAPECDIDYTFAQVDVERAVVDYTGNCGNCAAGVGVFAIEEALVPTTDGITVVRAVNTNTRTRMNISVQVRDGKVPVEGSVALAGVAGTGAPIYVEFLSPAGSVTGALLPTGSALDDIAGIPVSLVDATIPMVFVRALDIGADVTATPDAIDADHELMANLARLRTRGARLMQIPSSNAVPKIALVGPPLPFVGLDGAAHGSDASHLTVRVLSMGRCHRAIPITSAMCLAVAAQLDSGVVRASLDGKPPDEVTIAHPSGVSTVGVSVSRDPTLSVASVSVLRTARRLMEGFVLV